MLLSLRAILDSSMAMIASVSGTNPSTFFSKSIPISRFFKHFQYDLLSNPFSSLSVRESDSFTTMQHPFFPKYSIRIKMSDLCDPTVKCKHLAKDDVIFWTNRGPGCSSAIGLFVELGLCRLLDGTRPKSHPKFWNANANIFFIDQPIEVGFSYADYREYMATAEDAAKDMAAFVGMFFENLSQKEGSRNGRTNAYTMYSAYYKMTCTAASRPPVLDIKACVPMKQMLPRCEEWIKSSCLDQHDSFNCGAATTFCGSASTAPFWRAGLNLYNISIPSFNLAQDILLSLLERGVHVLVYVGDLDWACNWLRNENGQRELGKKKLREWEVEGRRNGDDEELTFATVPYNRPKESLVMVQRWMAGKEM
ncbi:alpha/beta-hydrolase [Dendrothele bispora CBS 962.96]|uniref:carboxypeptidase C n=1 Tax=Dendrothele bispora (strain CBS 962.96) TaxID=1314807 RepID=A0A4S8KR72_DENBC|nr:alpha/beta-hydrolase [Dendrothele bispora CBS 962.96]